MPEPYTQEEIDDALTALIAWAGNANQAVKYLEAEGMRAPSTTTLLAWARTRHWERYEELREKFATQAEHTLTNNYRDAARYATEVAMKAAALAERKIEDGTDPDPARSAANMMSVARQATDKQLALQGRPSQIVENRNPEQVLRGLAARYPQLFGLTEAPQLEAGDEH